MRHLPKRKTAPEAEGVVIKAIVYVTMSLHSSGKPPKRVRLKEYKLPLQAEEDLEANIITALINEILFLVGDDKTRLLLVLEGAVRALRREIE